MEMLRYIAALATGKPRQQVLLGVDFEWNNTSWVHNMYRAFELVFGAPKGIRKMMQSNVVIETGETSYVFYTLEARLAHYESVMRAAFKQAFAFQIVLVPPMVTTNGLLMPSPFMFAIAFDTTTHPGFGAGSSTQTVSHTITGSNPAMLGFFGYNNVGSTNSATYAGAAMTSITGTTAVSARTVQGFYKTAPATGANNLVLTFSGSSVEGMWSGMSYTGVDQTTSVEAFGTATATDPAIALSISVTTVTANAWVVGFAADRENMTWTVTSSNSTSRFDGAANGSVSVHEVDRTTTTAGSYAVSWSFVADGGPGVAVSLKPAATPTATGGFFMAASR